MFPEPSVRAIVSSKGCFMPVMPAVPKNSAHSDQPNAASTPIETSVSMVEVPCRALAQAARWNGSAPQTTTGAASVSESHCQLSNCSAGTIAIATTGTAEHERDQEPLAQRAGLRVVGVAVVRLSVRLRWLRASVAV